ncbi:MAG TPA: hypothetical protein VH540_12985 [Ktedonobacterales bacterium]|jgi:hypothetical protein
MRVRRGAKSQNARLQSLLKEINDEWDALTRSIQADRVVLNSLQPRMEHLRHQLRLTSGAAIDTSPALAAHLNILERKAEEVRKTIQLKEQERRALERHFDQARLVAAAQGQQKRPQGLRRHYSTGKSVLSRPLVRLLRGFRKSLRPLHLLRPSHLGKRRVSDDSPFSNNLPVNGLR